MDNPNKTPNNLKWKRTYWIVFLTGIAYILILGLFTWFFNNPI